MSELDELLERPRNKRKIVFGRNKAKIQFNRKDSDYLIISGSSAGVVLSGSNIVFDGTVNLPSLKFEDNEKLYFGTDSDSYIEFNEDADDYMIISGSTAGIALSGSVVKIDADTISFQNGETAVGFLSNSPGTYMSLSGSAFVDMISPMRFRDDRWLYFGTGKESSIVYDEAGDNFMVISGSATGLELKGSNIISSGSYVGISGSIVKIEGDIKLNSKTTIKGTGNSLFIGNLGVERGSHAAYSYVPTVVLPITTFDTITDLRNPANGNTDDGEAVALLADGQGGGEMIKLGAFDSGVNTKGMVVSFYNGAGSPLWYAADANVSTSIRDATALLGVALDVDGGSDEGLVLLRGYVRIDSSLMNNFTNANTDIGQPVYLSATSGEYDMNPPSGNNDIARIAGYMLDSDGTDHLIYFRPSNDWVKVSA